MAAVVTGHINSYYFVEVAVIVIQSEAMIICLKSLTTDEMDS